MRRVYVDMDGTIARFHDEKNYLKRMNEKGFFSNLQPFWNVVKAVEALASEGDVEVYILSSCVTEHCKEEKKAWLEKYLPGIPVSRYILVPAGADKALYVGHPLTEEDVLLDDYNRNLELWEAAGGRSIKLVNNINHKGLIGPLWRGRLCYERNEPAELLKSLKANIS